MECFSIAFRDTTSDDPCGELTFGQIQLADFSESFEVSLEYWTKDDYRSQWIHAIRRLVNGHERSCLITSITDPKTANFLFWWPCYRIEDQIVFQNEVLFLDQLDKPFDPASPYQAVADRVSFSDDGSPISEWKVPLPCLVEFLLGAEKAAEKAGQARLW